VISRVRWDLAKAESNRQKHGVNFYDAASIFNDPLTAAIDDLEHSTTEDRWLAVGQSSRGELLVVAYTIRNDDPWLIMARRPTPAERRRYMRGDEIRDRGEARLNLEDFPEVDFTNAVRGRHYIKPRGVRRVSINEEVDRYFRDDDALNDALRTLIAEGAPISEATGEEPTDVIVRVSLDEDVAKHYRTGDQVIDALRRMIREGRVPEPRDG
jgi:uncharacterized DUF497 family protein